MSIGDTPNPGACFVLASANPDKAEEIRAILAPAGVDLVPRPPEVPDVEETGATLLENARLKAVALVAATGVPAVADDTGLAVDALGGAPGVWSSRYAGPGATYADNVAKLLAALEGVPEERRTARFETVVLARFPDGSEVTASGAVEGRIATRPQGAGGFGYDPVFVPVEGDGRSFAEMSPAEKHALSHRGRAFRALARRLGLEVPGER
ncbi:MAG: RdgB/HAM1 family non-canonical purine NTP pyrophosphatase [Actinomycetota bacterium]|nr:RdgB/HAM1 family non-canonical purine NTP pyrophosphatase [Actinomycetota bacterium]